MSAELLRLPPSPDLVDRVYRALLDAISDGTLAAGVRITQEDLAARFAVSRQPVLQALRLLKKDGLLLDAPGRGVLVAPIDAEWIAHVYQVRGALDALAARLAAERRAGIDARLIADGRLAARSGDIGAMIEADIAFHSAIYAAAGNPLIAQSAALHWVHLRRVMGAVLRAAPQRESLWDEHQAIVDAIAAGDSAEATRLIDHHSVHAGEYLAARLIDVLDATQRGKDETDPRATPAVRP